MLTPSYKPNLEIPGGVVELNESPYVACKRELKEEIGLEIDLKGLLCIDYQAETESKTESLMFVFYGGDLSQEEIAAIRIDKEEIIDFAFLSLSEIKDKTTDSLFRRISRSIEAVEQGTIHYLEDQEIIG